MAAQIRSITDAHAALAAGSRVQAVRELAAYARQQAQRRAERAQRRTRWRMVFLAAFVGLCAFCIGRATAAQLHAVAHLASAHAGSRADGEPYNAATLGAALRVTFTPSVSLQAGAFRNSYDRHSNYLIAEWTPLRAGVLTAGAFAGAVTGYPYNDGRIGPAAGFVIRAQADRLSVALRLLPKVTQQQSSHTAAIEVGWRL